MFGQHEAFLCHPTSLSSLKRLGCFLGLGKSCWTDAFDNARGCADHPRVLAKCSCAGKPVGFALHLVMNRTYLIQ